jgi:tetratricopeptide (TPR) repeat protein
MDCKIGRWALALVILTGWSGAARATDDRAKADARDLAKAGKRDFDAGHWEDAELKFQRAYALAKVPTLAVWTARALVKRGQLVAGAELYRQALQLSPNDLWIGSAQAKAQADARQELEALVPRIPRLRVHAQGAEPGDITLSIDDGKITGAWAGIDHPLDPGRHRIVGKRYAETLELVIELQEGEGKDAFLKFKDGTTDGSKDGRRVAALAAVGGVPVDNVANLTANPLPPGPANSHQPIYATWWFWTGVGAAVVATTVTAIVLSRRSGGVCSGASYPCAELQ